MDDAFTTDSMSRLFSTDLRRARTEASLKKAAFLSVAITTVAVAASLIGIPMFITFAIRIQSQIDGESEYCRLKTRDLWSSVLSTAMSPSFLKDFLGREAADARAARSADILDDFPNQRKFWRFGREFFETHGNPLSSSRGGSNSEADPYAPYSPSPQLRHNPPAVQPQSTEQEGDYDTAATERSSITPEYITRTSYNPPVTGRCCCQCQGPAGDPGEAGEDGIDGLDGQAGQPGADGHYGDSKKLSEHHCYRPCPGGPPGTSGPQGPKGPKGAKGLKGPDGYSPYKSPKGAPGKRGPRGYSGKIGSSGRPGVPGKLVIVTSGQIGPPGLPGPPGYPGKKGEKGIPGKDAHYGPPGPPGDNGLKGLDGRYGSVGYPGMPGYPGLEGSCDHCPAPKVPSGYYVHRWWWT